MNYFCNIGKPNEHESYTKHDESLSVTCFYNGDFFDKDNSFPKCTFFSADSNYEVTLMTKTTVLYNGAITWQPPAIYKSSCAIDVEYFPYDEQTCFLKMGSWTYSGFQVGKKEKNM